MGGGVRGASLHIECFILFLWQDPLGAEGGEVGGGGVRGACLHIECFVFISLARPIWPDRMSFSRNGAKRLILIVSLSEAQNIWAGSRLTCLCPKRRAGRLSYSERCLCWGGGGICFN